MNTSPQPSTSVDSDKDIDLLDLLVLLSSKIKIFLALGILGAAMGWLWSQSTPVVYTSTSTLNVEALRVTEKISKFKTEVIASLVNSNQEFRDLLKDESLGTHTSISTSISPKDRLLIISTTASTPLQAQQLNARVLEKIYKLTAAQGKKAAYINTLIANEKNRVSQITQIIHSLEAKNKAPNDNEEKIIENLSRYKIERELSIADLQDSLEGIAAKDVVQAPNLPSNPTDKKLIIKISIGSIAGFLIALILVLMQHAIRTQLSDKSVKEKWENIARNIGFKIHH